MQTVMSPFGGESILLKEIHVSELARRYNEKCGADISKHLSSIEYVKLYECQQTGYKYWMPFEIAGNEEFYQLLARTWPNYYRKVRWEYGVAEKYLNDSDNVLEIGAGRGYFLKLIEGKCLHATGLELNNQAIKSKVCDSNIILEMSSEHSKYEVKYNKIYSFQVLEHIVNPKDFLEDCVRMLKPNGMLVVSVPNNNFVLHKQMEDIFDFPPHHMGMFDEDVFRRLAGRLNLELLDVLVQPIDSLNVRVTEQTRRKLVWRIYSYLGVKTLRLMNEPGANLLATFRKST